MSDSPPDLPVIPEATYSDRQELARGGLGRVLRATDRSMGRVVALKELLPGGPGTEARFVREALVTGRLEHPSIVPVYEAGRWPSGEPFYTMKLVSGRPLRDVVKETTTLAERIALVPHVIAVAEALAYAHSKRVIHRDIKPANVIIGQFGETVVIDWGLAKELDADDDDPEDEVGSDEPSGELTRFGEVVGTPAYMAPEQAQGNPVDESADVYALGALLYFTLSGTAPHDPTRVEAAPPAGPAVGSAVATRAENVAAHGTHTDMLTVAAMRDPVPIAERRPDVPRELVAIVDKAMARDPAARYPTAKELGEDLKAFQTGRLVSAHHYTAWQLVRRWVARNRVAVVVAAVALLLLAFGATASIKRIVDARAAEQRARQQAERRSRDLVLLQAKASLSRDPTAAIAWLETYPRGAPGWEAARPIAAEAQARGVARDVWRIGEGQVAAARLARDGKTLVALGGDGVIRVRGAVARAWRELGAVGATGGALDISPDGAWVVAGGDDRNVVLFPMAGGAPRVLGTHDDTVQGVAFSPDGKRVATTSVDRTVRIWPIAGGEAVVLRGHELMTTGVAFAPDGKRVATGSEDATLRLWDAASGTAERLFRADRSVLVVAFAPDGKRIAAATRSGVRVWDLATGGDRLVGDRADSEAYGVAWDGAGQLVTSGVDGLAVWDPQLAGARWLFGHDGAVGAVDVARDGRTVVSGGADGTVRVWPLRPEAGVLLREGNQPGGTSPRPRVSRDGLVAAPGQDGSILLVRGGAVVRTLRGHDGPVRDVAFAPDGKRLASYGLDRSVRVWDVASGDGRVVTTVPTQAFRLRFASDGRRLAFTQGYEELDVIDAASGATVCVLRGRNDSASDFAPDGRSIAYADGYDLMVADLASCSSRRVASHRGTIFNVAWHPDGRLIATASADRTVGLFHVDGSQAMALRGHEREVYGVAFSPDGRTLASAGFDGAARLWDVERGTALFTLRGHEKVLLYVGFTADGRSLVTAGADDTVRVWDAERGEMVQREGDTGHGGFAIEPDGRWLVSAGPRGLRRWPLDRRDAVPATAADLASFLEAATSARIDEAGRLVTPGI